MEQLTEDSVELIDTIPEEVLEELSDNEGGEEGEG